MTTCIDTITGGLTSRSLRVAYLGPPGSYTSLAARQVFGDNADLVAVPAHEVPRQVQRGPRRDGCDFGVLATANIQYGPIENTFSALYNTRDVQIVGEVFLPIEFKLLSATVRLDDIHTVMSHDAALSQCSRRLDRLERQLGRPLARKPTTSTSAAVQHAVQLPGVAALGSADAAQCYGASVLLEQMQDHEENVTCFWVFGHGARPAAAARNKTVFLVELAPGIDSMHRLMGLLAGHDVQVTMFKEQLIPAKSRAANWSKAYFIECEGHVEDPGLNAVYRALRRPEWEVLRGRRGRLLGSFPAFDVESLQFPGRSVAGHAPAMNPSRLCEPVRAES